MALILARPLERIGEIPLEEIALDGPSLCEQTLRALQSDGELDVLTGRTAADGPGRPTPALRLAAIAGAREPEAAVDAVEALRGVLWEALAGELRHSPGRELAEAGDRLAHVCAQVLGVAVGAMAGPRQAGARTQSAGMDVRSPMPEGSPPGPEWGRAVIVDELAQARPRPAPPHAPAGTIGQAQAAEIEIRDERAWEGPTAWIGSIGAQLERFGEDGVPFAVLLVELMDLERLREEESPAELDRMAGAVEGLLAAELRTGMRDLPLRGAGGPLGPRSSGSLKRERVGRFWMLVAQADRPAAQLLVERLEREANTIRTAGGRPLALAIGMASCPQDGRDAPALAAHADVGLYAARAAARRASVADQPA